MEFFFSNITWVVYLSWKKHRLNWIKDDIASEWTVQLSVQSPISFPFPQIAMCTEKAFKDFCEMNISALRAQQSKWSRSASSSWLMDRLTVITDNITEWRGSWKANVFLYFNPFFHVHCCLQMFWQEKGMFNLSELLTFTEIQVTIHIMFMLSEICQFNSVRQLLYIYTKFQ